MAKKKIYKADDLFWALLRKHRVKEDMARLILTSKHEVSSEKLGLAEELVEEGVMLNWEAWEHFRTLNPNIIITHSLLADSATRTIKET